MSEAPGPANHRLKSYKNKALDSQELRRRREEEGIQLRKQKRDEQVGQSCGIKYFSFLQGLHSNSFTDVLLDFH